jgi:hypothetical protein
MGSDRRGGQSHQPRRGLLDNADDKRASVTIAM